MKAYHDRIAHWKPADANESGDLIIRSMAENGIDHLFFTSGTDIMFYQESIARAEKLKLKTPRLISVAHEITSMSAALGYAAASGKPVATAAHVDLGTQAYGAGIHNASRSGLPVLITAGCAPTAYPSTMRGGRDAGHFWTQQPFDQNGIVRQYVKWDHRLEYQDNPGLVVSRALQVAQTYPRGPVYMSLPREVTMMEAREDRFPSARQLGIASEPSPSPESIEQLAGALVNSINPVMVVSRSGRDPNTVADMIALCELLGMAVVEGTFQGYMCMPMNHPLYLGRAGVGDADVVVALDAGPVPWMPGATAPKPSAEVFIVDSDPVGSWVPILETEASERIIAGAGQTLRMLRQRVEDTITSDQKEASRRRLQTYQDKRKKHDQEMVARAHAGQNKRPIDPHWACYCIGKFLDGNTTFLDTTITPPLLPYLKLSRAGSFIHNPSTAGGWGSGAAFGVKLAQPERDVVLATGDGFYMYDVPSVAISAARRYNAPFMAVIIQNLSYNTGTEEVDRYYPKGYASKAGYEGGYLEPAVDFAKEAAAAGAHGETVEDPERIMPALMEGRRRTREGVPAVIAIRVPKLSS